MYKRFAFMIIGLLLQTASSEAQESTSTLLKRDVICSSQDWIMTISQDLTKASLVDSDGVRKLKVDYQYNSGGRGQILVLKIIGLDGFNQDTTINNIFALEYKLVHGSRTETTGYNTRAIEKFQCTYVHQG